MRRLLIVEDHFAQRAILEIVFQGEYEIQSASNAIEALEILDTWRPDLVITDQSMPGMTGIELIKSLRKNKGSTQIQIILCSSHLTDDLIAEARALGAACIAKPFNLGALRNLVGNYFKY